MNTSTLLQGSCNASSQTAAEETRPMALGGRGETAGQGEREGTETGGETDGEGDGDGDRDIGEPGGEGRGAGRGGRRGGRDEAEDYWGEAEGGGGHGCGVIEQKHEAVLEEP